MTHLRRRRFLKAGLCATGALATDLGFLLPVSRAAATDVSLSPSLVKFGPDMDPLVKLIRNTPRKECVGVFVDRLDHGLSYQRFLAALFLAASETGDLHQLAKVHAAHRVSSNARIEERLLPLFWVLDGIKKGQEGPDKSGFLRQLKGSLPTPGEAPAVFSKAMREADKTSAELAIVALSNSQGSRQAMSRLWEFACRDLAGTLGHLPIGVANAWRTLDAIGWQHAELGLRYMARETCRPKADNTYGPNRVRVEKTLPQLPPQWASKSVNRSATIELYGMLRAGDSPQACDFICSELERGTISAQAVWDAIALAAADLIFRYKSGGGEIGSYLVHVVTSTNSLRFGFDLIGDSRTRLLLLLQAAGFVADSFVGQATRKHQLRAMNLVADLGSLDPGAIGTVEEIFELLPFKKDHYEQKSSDERSASDSASRKAFTLLKDPVKERAFLQTARTFLCVKASEDPHDFKFPAAIIEEASLVSREWRPYLLASAVHALHGTKSGDSAVLIQARDALA